MCTWTTASGSPRQLIGSLTAGGQLLAACTALAAPALSRRFGRVPVITGGAGAMVLCLIPLALIAHWAVAGVACMALVALSSIRRSVYIVFQQELVPEHWRVTMSSALTMALRYQHCRRFARRRLDDRRAGVSGVVFD